MVGCVHGFNALFGAKQKLGSWDSYLAMRQTIVQANGQQASLSKDLGAFAGLLFEIGSNRLVLAGNAENTLKEFQERAHKAARKRHEQALADVREASTVKRVLRGSTTRPRFSGALPSSLWSATELLQPHQRLSLPQLPSRRDCL